MFNALLDYAGIDGESVVGSTLVTEHVCECPASSRTCVQAQGCAKIATDVDEGAELLLDGYDV